MTLCYLGSGLNSDPSEGARMRFWQSVMRYYNPVFVLMIDCLKVCFFRVFLGRVHLGIVLDVVR